MRKTYQRRLPENPNKDYYYILRETGNTEPILIEYGFIDNINDVNKLKNNLEDYGEAVVKALTEYLNYPYNKEETKDYYIVEKGDTLYKISRMFNISIDELKRINNLNDNNLSIGQKIYLIEQENNYQEYIVKKGDSLWAISRKYDIPVNELIEINNLKDLTIKVGDILLVPNQEDYYTVEKGDTLWSVAKKFNTTVDNLKQINNLTSNLLSIGQTLKTK